MNRLIEGTARLLIVISTVAAPCVSFASDLLPQPEPQFKGKISTSVKDSVPDWPQPLKAPANAPNIVLVLLDDIGCADTSTFGGVAQTPELDKLAAQGLRYINFNVTGTCSPTRAALLTGRNHHRVGFGVAESSGGFPGYNFMWKKSTVSVADVLRRNGYSTAVFGKWHNTQQGFERLTVLEFQLGEVHLGCVVCWKIESFVSGPAASLQNQSSVQAASLV